MGAHGIEVYQSGQTMQEAFSAAHEEAVWEHGHDPYNGTISTISSAQQYQREIIPKSGINSVIHKVWEEEKQGKLTGMIEKWTSCAAIPVAADDNFTWRKETFTFDDVVLSEFDFKYFQSYSQATVIGLLNDRLSGQVFKSGGDSIEVELISTEDIIYDDSYPAYLVGKPGKKCSLKVTVQLLDGGKASQPDGWLFIGWAAS